MHKNNLQIDAVITWVDGNDENHAEKRQKALLEMQGKSKNELLTGRDQTRFIDNGELKYCIRSIRKFAPWINKIYLVTDNQVPRFLTAESQEFYQVQIVDHKEIFKGYEQVLPTFNTRTIESALWRVPGLADHFIYFNDDFVITRPVKPEHFFDDNKVILRGRWSASKRYGAFRIKLNEWVSFVAKRFLGITRSMHLLQQIKSAELAGIEGKYYRTPHVPHPVRKQTLEQFFGKNPEIFEKNIQYPFRNMNQFSAIFLAHHLEIKQGNADLNPADDYLMINGEMDFSFRVNQKLKQIEDENVRFICIQGFERFKDKQRREIESVLKKVL